MQRIRRRVNLWAVRPVLMTAAWDPQARWKSNRSLQVYISSRKSCKIHKILILNDSVTVPWLIWLRRIWVGSKCKSSPGEEVFWRFWKLPLSFWNFPSHMFCLPCDQVLLVSLIAINDGHFHRHPVQVHHSPHLTRIHINHLQGQPTT